MALTPAPSSRFEDRTFLLGVGAQRSGTTWLGSYFAEHADVYFSPVKELHFFDSRFLRDRFPDVEKRLLTNLGATIGRLGAPLSPASKRANALVDRMLMQDDIARYFDFFRTRVGNHRVFGEITPEYALLNASQFREIRDVHPNTRVVYLIRNPADRYLSALRYFKKQHPKFDIEKAYWSYVNRPNFRDLTSYHITLDQLEAAFSAEKIFVCFYERLFAEELIRSLCDFLGIDYVPAKFEKSANRSPSIVVPDDVRSHVISAFADTYRAMFDRYRGNLPANWIVDYDQLRPRPMPDARNTITDRFEV